MLPEQNAKGPYIYQKISRLQYKSYRQPAFFGEFSTDLGFIVADVYNHLRLRDSVLDNRFQKYIMGDRRLRYFRYNVRNHLQSF